MSATMTKASASKKRSAPDDRGAPRKKQHLDHSAKPKNLTSKAKSASAKPKSHDRPSPSTKKTRSKPVTSTELVEDDDDEEEWTSEDDAGDPMDEGANGGEDATGESAQNKQSAREAHQQQRAVQAERKAAKPHSALLAEAKQVWRLAHQKNITKTERTQHVDQLMSIVRGHVQEVVLKHDASRIIQTLVKHGSPAQRDEVAAELKGKYKELVQSRYSKFLVGKLVRYSSTHRSAILAEFKGHVVRLLLHREASQIVADAYELWANAADRAMLVRDFYGKEAALFSAQTPTGLKGILNGADDEKRKRILTGVREQLELVFNNSEKGTVVSHSIVHHALLEYLEATHDLAKEDDREKFRREMFDVCQELLAEMVHTKDGSRAVREFLAEGTAKDRKQIVKCLKPHVERIAKDEEAQLVLLAALDIIDDTKLTAKSLVVPLVASPETVNTLAESSTGRRSLYGLLVPRNTRHFTPALIVNLASTDAARDRTSKKDVQTRRDEIRSAASPGLVEWAAKYAAEAVADPGRALLLLEVMLEADGDKSAAIDALLAIPLDAPAEGPHPAARLFKTLLQGGHFSRASNSVVKSPRWDAIGFARKLGRDRARQLGAFVLAELCERVREDGTDQEQRDLAISFDKAECKRIEASGEKGSAVLLEKVMALKAGV
ncbi:ARM repeat-containing protein [Exidia glandulosa HHB12029]|uniref:ARM repeat-containing protein n=1 Tax=Exidia glandulosa HHB12029 TaxID=1314781 RepID=A0A165J7Z3_EXIGL|nr:ARM repeat-containing protein [Exidia glandulosa HHB12029]